MIFILNLVFRLIERYYKQLTEGCGRSSCDNADCASSGHRLSPNEAAARSLQCLSVISRNKSSSCGLVFTQTKAKLCEERSGTSCDEVEAMEVATPELPSPSSSPNQSCSKYIKKSECHDYGPEIIIVYSCPGAGNLTRDKLLNCDHAFPGPSIEHTSHTRALGESSQF